MRNVAVVAAVDELVMQRLQLSLLEKLEELMYRLLEQLQLRSMCKKTRRMREQQGRRKLLPSSSSLLAVDAHGLKRTQSAF